MVDHGAAAYAPPRGLMVWAEAVVGNGMEMLGLETLPNDSVVIYSWGSESGSGSEVDPVFIPDPLGPPACNDYTYNSYGFQWTNTFKWYFNSGSTPSGLNVDNAESAMRSATSNITFAANDCGLGDNVSATAAFQGRTNTNVNIQIQTVNGAPTPVCGNTDGVSVSSFGDLPVMAEGANKNFVGYACWWANNGTATAADTRLNKDDYSWTTTPGSGCVDAYSVEAVMTHERGHTFGLDHVKEADHPNLTMSNKINGTCQNSEATLGKGDVFGLESLY